MKLNNTDSLHMGLHACLHLGIITYIVVDKTFSAEPKYVLPLVLVGVTVSAAMSVFQILATSRKTYFTALSIHLGISMFLTPFLAPIQATEFLFFLAVILGISFQNPFPINLLFASLFNGIILSIRAFVLSRSAFEAQEVVSYEIELGLFLFLVTITTCLMVFYREKLIDSQSEAIRLDGLVDRLTKANLGYQEYAKTIEESSADNERKRVSRDIHDVVGYTLTNNITMMEAIKDMMRINPLGIASLVNSARENAEEGLARVREALHLLRGQRISYPKGRRAIEKLIFVFEQATGVVVELSLDNATWEYSPEVEFALYHVIQESLINAFRHGKASKIRIFFNTDLDTVTLKIRDNGGGSGQFKEDIGIAGMRERIEQLGGNLSAHAIADGFEVTASVQKVVEHENND